MRDPLEDLRNGGTLSRSLPGYQERGAQIEMAQLVKQAIQEEKHAILEAACGTGKSLGYLIPLIRSGKRGIVSTANKALQDQIYHKDIPFCQQHIQEFDAALLKGKGNYLCLKRFADEASAMHNYGLDESSVELLEEMVAEDSWNGDFETLPFAVPGEVRSRIGVDEYECARKACSLYKDCFYYRMRERAKDAQIVVTNHDILLLNAQIGFKLLPSYDVTVIDEAHAIEGVASKQFTIEIKESQIVSLLRLQRVRANTKGATQVQVEDQAVKVWDRLGKMCPNQGRVAFTTKIDEGILLASYLESLSRQMVIESSSDSATEEGTLSSQTVKRIKNLAENVRLVFSHEDKQFVYYLERENDRVIAARTPLDVAPFLKKTLFLQDSIICTSATLSTPGPHGNGFDFYQEQIGMDRPDTKTCILPLVFNYQRQAVLYIPSDLPEPAYGQTEAAAAYEHALGKRIQQLVEASRGRAFLLFSSRRMLGTVADIISPQLKAKGYTLLTQGDLPTGELLALFRTSDKAVLFGLKTFWEGVDVQGEALSLVVIDKLPFSSVDDPVVKGKLDYIDANGHNSFLEYSVPAITLALKQGVGRLIRSDMDQGVMAILDTRLHTKAYGERILACLPPAKRTTELQHVRSFFTLALKAELPQKSPETRQAAPVCRAIWHLNEQGQMCKAREKVARMEECRGAAWLQTPLGPLCAKCYTPLRQEEGIYTGE